MLKLSHPPRLRGGLLLAMALLAPPLSAQTELARIVDAAVALRGGHALAVARRDVGTAMQRKADALFAEAPSASLKYQTDQVGSDLGYREWEGGVDLPLWLPGQSDAWAEEASSTFAVSDATRDARGLDIAGEVRERLWQGVIARAAMRQADAALALARELAADVTRRVDAGELPRGDRLLAEQELLMREEESAAAAQRYAQAAHEFRHYTGRDLPVEIAPETPAAGDEIGDGHPALRLALSENGQARAHRNRVDGERATRPNLWLGAKSARAAIGSGYESSLGIELSIPFGSAAHTGTALADAEAGLTESELALREVRLRLEDALHLAQLELEHVRTALARTERRQALGDERLALNRRAFELGETDLVYLLQAQSDALSARNDHELRALELALAIAHLNQALGVMPQ